MSPHVKTPSCCACNRTCKRDISDANRSAASLDSISRSCPLLSRTNTLVSPSLLVLNFAISRPSSVNCQVFCRRSSFWMERVCSLTHPFRTRFRIVRLTFGGCCAQASAMPGRVKAAVTMNRSARWSWRRRCSKTRSETATLTFGSPSAMCICGEYHVQAFRFSA